MVGIDYHINVDEHRYSVPYQLVGMVLTGCVPGITA